MSKPFNWSDSALTWAEAFRTPEVQKILDEQVMTLLNLDSSHEQIAMARANLRMVQRLESLPGLAVAKTSHEKPVVQSALAWRERLLTLFRRQLSTLKELDPDGR